MSTSVCRLLQGWAILWRSHWMAGCSAGGGMLAPSWAWGLSLPASRLYTFLDRSVCCNVWVTASAVATVLPLRLSTCYICRYMASQRTQTPFPLLAECTACCSQMNPQALTPRTCLAASHKVSACLRSVADHLEH